MAHEIAGLTQCVICGRKFASPTHIIIGQPRTVGFLQKLTEHLEKEHPETEEAIGVLVLQYIGLLRMLNFRTTDPELTQQVDILRWSIHQQTITARISDKTIDEKTTELALHLADEFYGLLQMEHDRTSSEVPDYLVMMKAALVADIKKRVSKILTGMRDVMQEPDKYQLRNVATKPAIIGTALEKMGKLRH